MLRLAMLIFGISLVATVITVLGSQIIMHALGIPDGVTNPVALLLGLGAIALSEWSVRRWWSRRHTNL